MKGQTEKDRAKEGSAVRGAICDQHFEGRAGSAQRGHPGRGRGREGGGRGLGDWITHG